ncbi:AAA domain-containing protein [archaeon]|jgi:Mg-chelatase subunit ChlI|nr:AAA domain-containing protein [archaeon]MBT4648030.1 AAA domain-containing protein [archaeon]MBT6822716.1 AAA domain-containing protein [archaeon]MBT7392459.1 AAA domain-containing protein [archaeon]
MEDLTKILIKEKFEDIYGQDDVKLQVRSAIMMRRNIILVGPPGVGKTTLAKNIAKILPDISITNFEGKNEKVKGEDRFVRVQGSPDLTAEDLIGDIDPIKAIKFGPLDIKSFTPGKIFKANGKILFFDEINRCSEKLQNALLQVLEEKTASISSYDVDVESDFIFIGTMNPNDISTENLSDVFLDRFDLIYMGYPENFKIEEKIVTTKGKEIVEFPKKLLDFTIKFVRELRLHDDLEKVPSVRATIGLYERAQANAMLLGRKKVNYQDIESAAISVLTHRIRLKPSVKYLKTPEKVIMETLEKFKEEGDIP